MQCLRHINKLNFDFHYSYISCCWLISSLYILSYHMVSSLDISFHETVVLLDNLWGQGVLSYILVMLCWQHILSYHLSSSANLKSFIDYFNTIYFFIFWTILSWFYLTFLVSYYIFYLYYVFIYFYFIIINFYYDTIYCRWIRIPSIVCCMCCTNHIIYSNFLLQITPTFRKCNFLVHQAKLVKSVALINFLLICMFLHPVELLI